MGGLMLIPALTAVVFGEWPSLFDFLIGSSLSFCVGFIFLLIGRPSQRGLTWMLGFTVAAFSWLVLMFLAAVPYYLSGHWGAFVDALFDVMSGFTTTGLVLVQDLDHIPNSVNMWRHILTYLGGQGMVVLALTVLSKGLPGAFKLYVGEAKDERLMPSVGQTARAIWFISVVWLIFGTVALWLSGLAIGMKPVRAFLHGLWVFMGAWSTGGFAPQSQNIMYYHSFLLEAVTVPIMIAGSFNFGLHFAIWTGKRSEIYRNLETRVFFVTLSLFTLVGFLSTVTAGVYSDALSLARRIVYQFISAQTTTGFSNIFPQQFVYHWPTVVLLAMTLAMLFGGSASSTAGGFKGVRVGVVAKAIRMEVRKLMAPESAVIVEKVHMGQDSPLEDRNVKVAALIILLYIVIFTIGTVAGVAYGYPLPMAIFEAGSVTGNVGLSSGLTSPLMPWPLKILYILMMWMARLEFMSVFVFFAILWRFGRR
ncbi:MAG TPA: TrkH family potassium uptake protein [Firmicutes bacterium]|nr:TrkH family potassium uptake protein [Candidatus Fermentithermobacillaceae bacterium]